MRNRGGCGTLNLSYVKDYVKKKKQKKKPRNKQENN